MPGTILVSVLEFMDLPSSSSTSIRVSMGKIEYQISDKGNFSFPLTSLRDDLIVKIQDADGNEISRTGVHIRLILEKGVWEDIFPLGKGHLHLKLQFILNDEERDRIRIMRQSALKKKHDELLSSGRRGPESDSSSTIGNAASPFSTNDERLFPDVLSAPSSQESPKRCLQHEAISRLQDPAGFFDDKESGTGNVGEAQLDQKQLNPNFADQYKSTKPAVRATNLTQLQHKGKKSTNQSPSEKQPQGVIGSEDMAILSRSTEQNGGMQCSEKKSTSGRTPSNVKKMISAFESGLAQDKRPHIKPPPRKYQSGKIETKDSSKTQHLEQDKSWDTKSAGILQESQKSAFLARDFRQDLVQQINLFGHVSRKDHTRQLKLSTINILNKPTDSYARNKFEDNSYSFESSGVWIFPDETRNICRTTSGKSVMGIEESQDTKCLSHQRILCFSKLENMEKNASYVGSGTKGTKYEKIKENEESRTRSPNDNGDENSGAPFSQVIKVAIIIGFGVLVLLTRQRKKRYED